MAHWLKDDTSTAGGYQHPKEHIKHMQEFEQALTDVEAAMQDNVKLRDVVVLSAPLTAQPC